MALRTQGMLIALLVLAACTAQVNGTGSGSTGGGGTGGTTSGATNGTSGTSASSGSTSSTTAGSSGTTGTSAGSSGSTGDTYLPWHGGPSYYASWSHGLSTDVNRFPIAVWLQSPTRASDYKAVGVNQFIGIYDGISATTMAPFDSTGMPVIAEQSGSWSSYLNDPVLNGWLQPDEPDNAQDNGHGGYDPCIDPSVIVGNYNTWRHNDATRPVYLGLGRGVADVNWGGRGTCTGNTAMYPQYAKGADILGYDIYPVNEDAPLEIIATGVDNLRLWSDYAKPVFQDIEASNFNNTALPTPAQIKTEIWMALVHGAAGIQYFCHQFQPTFIEDACLENATTKAAMTSINAQIQSLAPALNSPPLANGATVHSSNTNVPVDILVKRTGGALYIFAVSMRGSATTATFMVRTPTSGTVTVIDEGRTRPFSGGTFTDAFDGYAVHLYKITN